MMTNLACKSSVTEAREPRAVPATLSSPNRHLKTVFQYNTDIAEHLRPKSVNMRLEVFAFFAFLIACALAQTVPLKAVMVSYNQETPESVLDQAKQAIEQAGGIITHEFSKMIMTLGPTH